MQVNALDLSNIYQKLDVQSSIEALNKLQKNL